MYLKRKHMNKKKSRRCSISNKSGIKEWNFEIPVFLLDATICLISLEKKNQNAASYLW